MRTHHALGADLFRPGNEQVTVDIAISLVDRVVSVIACGC